jgi:hypothetical protein
VTGEQHADTVRWVFRDVDEAMRRARKAIERLDNGRRDDGAAQVMEELVRRLEIVLGDIYLWRLEEIDSDKAMEGIRDALGL